MAQIQGYKPIYDSRVNGRYMCASSHNDCDSIRSLPSSHWDRIGRVDQSRRRLLWSFTNEQRKQGYQFEMIDLPKAVHITSMPDTIRMTMDNRIRIAQPDRRDSPMVEIMFLQSDEPTRQRKIPFLNKYYKQFHIKAIDGEITLLGSLLKQTFNKLEVTKLNAYFNVSSIRQVIKRVDDKKVMLTYQVSNWRQVNIR